MIVIRYPLILLLLGFALVIGSDICHGYITKFLDGDVSFAEMVRVVWLGRENVSCQR